MKVHIATKLIELYFCNGHYDIHSDEMLENGFRLRVGNYRYRLGKGWIRLNKITPL